MFEQYYRLNNQYITLHQNINKDLSENATQYNHRG